MRLRQRPTLPHSCPCSTIGAGRLNFRVRDGIGCGPSAIATGKLGANRSSHEIFRMLWTGFQPVQHRISSDCQFIERDLIFSFQEWWATGVVHTTEIFYGQASRAISTGQLNALPHLHSRPINLVVYEGPYAPLGRGKRHLEGGFPLRCFQRLSFPNIDTQRIPLGAIAGTPEVRPSRSSRTKDRASHVSCAHDR